MFRGGYDDGYVVLQAEKQRFSSDCSVAFIYEQLNNSFI